jgi:ribosomal-protein-alanine N-acetyltransferase
MQDETAIRLATPADAFQIACLSRDCIEQGLPWRWTPSRVLRCIRDAATNVAVVREKERVTGFGIMRYNEDDAHLLLLAVDPDRRRLGIASALLAWLEEVARTAGSVRVRVEARQANDEARCFYNEHGYHERALRDGMYGEAVDGVVLEKWLRHAATEDEA